MSEPIYMSYRANKCKTCKVKFGMGNCAVCRKFRAALTHMAEAALKQFEMQKEEDATRA